MSRFVLAALCGAGAVVVVWRWVAEVAMAPLTDLDEQYDTVLLPDPYVEAVVSARLTSLNLVDGEWQPRYTVR